MAFTVLEAIEGAQGDSQEREYAWVKRQDWVRWLNESLQEISDVARPLEDHATIDLQPSKVQYDLPDDCIRVKRVAWGDDPIKAEKIIPSRSAIENDELGRSDNNFTHDIRQGPKANKKLTILPEPDKGDGGKTIVITYVKTHPYVSDDNDEIFFPRQLKKYIIQYMLFKFSVQDDDRESNFHFQKWSRAVIKTTRRIQDESTPTRFVDGHAAQRKRYHKRQRGRY